MRRVLLLVILALSFGGVAAAQTANVGAWVTNDFGQPNQPNPISIVLRMQGQTVTGWIARATDSFDIFEGKVQGNVISFKVSASGRITTFTGKPTTPDLAELAFTRSAEVALGGTAGGSGIYGVNGPKEFVAKRDAAAVPAFLAMRGSWQANPAKSTYSGPPPQSIVPMFRQYIPRQGGSLAYVSFFVNEQGVPTLHTSVVKPDGKDYPAHTTATVLAALAGENPMLQTIAVKVIDDHTIESTVKNPNGTVNQILTQSISTDGKTMTEKTKMMNPQGEVTARNDLLYERKR